MTQLAEGQRKLRQEFPGRTPGLGGEEYAVALKEADAG